MNNPELPLPEKIFPVEYAGFFDFNEEGIYDTSVINRDDYPNADLIAKEIAKRYNNFESMKEAIETQLQIIEALISSKRVVNLDESIAYYKQLLESIK